MTLKALRTLAVLAIVLASCKSAPPVVTEAPPPPPPPAAPPPPPSKAGIVDEAALDRSVDPCEDFYQFACGGWLKATPIPADRAQWSRSFSEIGERNLNTLHEILEKDATAKGGDAATQKLGDYYATCMDEQKAEAASLAALKLRLAAIAKVKDGKSLAVLLGGLQLDGVGALFNFGQEQDH